MFHSVRSFGGPEMTQHHRAGYHLFEITGGGANCKIAARARGLLPGTATVGDLGPLVL